MTTKRHSATCSGCKRKRALTNGQCDECSGAEIDAHQAASMLVMAERAELRRHRKGLAHTIALPTRDGWHEGHLKHLTLVAGCRACSAIGHRLPPQNWRGA